MVTEKEQLREQQRKKLLAEIQREDHLISQCFKGSGGEKALEVLKKLFYDRPSYVKGDSHHTAFREGQRDVVGFILEAIERTEVE